MRARKKQWAPGELEANELIIRNPKELKGKWKTLFDGSASLMLEIGCGKGRFITKTAAKNPGIGFIAMEREQTILAAAARLAREAGVENVRFILGDAKELLEYFAQKELSRIYLNFSDPWPRKKKWAKRRLTHRSFLALYREVLGADREPELFFKTDNSILFDFSLKEFEFCGWRLENVTRNLHAESYAAENIMTEYERRFHERNQPIYRLEAYAQKRRGFSLCGMPGSGKSSVGRLLAVELGMSFADADVEIEKRAGKKISEMFAEEGEPAFRRLEREVIAELCQRENTVIATGGGTVLNPENVAALKSAGTLIYLKCRLDILIERTERSNARPLLEGDKKAAMERLYGERERVYSACADVLADISDYGREEAAEHICGLIQKN